MSEAAQQAVRDQERYQHYLRSRLEMMPGYAEVRDCRRKYLLNYFGETLEEPCGFCDNCKTGVIVEEDSAFQPFPLNSRVVHSSWGEGLVMRYEGDKMVNRFWILDARILDWLRNHRTELDKRQNSLMIPLIGPERPELLCEDEELETLFFRSSCSIRLGIRLLELTLSDSGVCSSGPPRATQKSYGKTYVLMLCLLIRELKTIQL